MIAAAKTVINFVFAEKRLAIVTAKEAWKTTFLKPRHLGRQKSYKIGCLGCGKEVVPQVFPFDDKKLLWLGRFSKRKISKEEI